MLQMWYCRSSNRYEPEKKKKRKRTTALWFASEMGDTTVTPSCKNYVLECGSCANGKPRLTYPDNDSFRLPSNHFFFFLIASHLSFRTVILRALFLLAVQNPQRAYWGSEDIANVLLANPSAYICAINFKTAGIFNTLHSKR